MLNAIKHTLGRTLSLMTLGTALFFLPVTLGAGNSANDAFRQLDLFGDVFERVRGLYVDEKTDKELIEAAINGMLSSLDPHSGYLPAESFEDMQVETRGSFGGLGIQVTMEEGLVKVISPIDETPAARAGMQAGDLITHLDDEPVLGLTLEDAVERMRGLVGTPISLTVIRGEEEPFDVKITRDVIKIQSVRSEVEGDGQVGYLRISTFSGTTYEGLLRNVKKLDEEHGDKLSGYILDLRNNPGGLLNQAIAVSDAFLEKGEIVSTRGRDDNDVDRHTATPGDIINGKPLIVLVNGGSASASEIVAGALQDHRRALILGTQSFGKGSVQSIMELPGFGAIRLTTARYFTPAGTSIQAKGITPDIYVEHSRIESLETGSGRRSEASLRGSLANPDDETSEEGAAEGAETPEGDDVAAPAEEGAEDTAEAEEEEFVDYQLLRAVDLLRGMALFGNQAALGG